MGQRELYPTQVGERRWIRKRRNKPSLVIFSPPPSSPPYDVIPRTAES